MPGLSQYNPDSIYFYYPDTSLVTEQSLLLIENATGIYFSYNPANLPVKEKLNLSPGRYNLTEFMQWISQQTGLEYTLIDNQMVFHRPGVSPLGPFRDDESIPVGVHTIQGLVSSYPGGDHLPFCTVWIPSNLNGTIANAEGHFILKIAGPNFPDSIAVSCMGYQTRVIPIVNLNDSLNHIQLTPSIIPIQEVIIRRTEPTSLIHQALERLEDNYFLEPVRETAFYRESIRRNDMYINVSEAVLSIYKPGLNSSLDEQVKVIKGRKNLDIRETDTIVVKLQAGLMTSFLLDIARNLPDFLNPEYLYDFQYRMSDIITLQGKPTYAIDFNKKINSKPPHYQGRFYIDLETLAFTGAEFEINPHTITKTAQSMVLRKPRNLKVRPLSAAYQVWYKSDGKRYYLSMARAETSFRIRKRNKLIGSEYRTVSELAVTQLQTVDAKRIRARETARVSDIFADLLGGSGRAFWGQYNYIVPEESLEEAIIRFGGD